MGVYFFEKSLSFLSRVQRIVFEILKFATKYGKNLGYFPPKWQKLEEMKKKYEKQ